MYRSLDLNFFVPIRIENEYDFLFFVRGIMLGNTYVVGGDNDI